MGRRLLGEGTFLSDVGSCSWVEIDDWESTVRSERVTVTPRRVLFAGRSSPAVASFLRLGAGLAREALLEGATASIKVSI
jgi:hypothetical protein